MLLQSRKSVSTLSLIEKLTKSKISWKSPNPYNQRWQFKWKPAYYTYPREGHEHTKTMTPEATKDIVPIFWAYYADIVYRWIPGMECVWDRRHRCFDKFNVYLLPFSSVLMFQFTHLALGFKVLSVLPWMLMYTRIRDRTLDPDFKETYLRDMLYNNAEITKYFNEETIHVMDYDFEYDVGFPNAEKFPEFNNKVFRFFNTDTSMCTGFFKFGDVESGAIMTLEFKTMPIAGKYRYQVGEPFYFYDLRAKIVHNGVFSEVVLVDEKESLKKVRPFLFLI